MKLTAILILLIASIANAATVTLNPGDDVKSKGIQANDTVIVPAATFNVDDWAPPTNVTFKGVRGKSVFRSSDRKFGFKLEDGRKLTFIDCGFDGGAIEGKGTSTLVVDWCRFTNFNRGPNGAFGGGLAVGSGGHGGGWTAKGSITNSTFQEVGHKGWAVGFYTCDGFTITDNEFIDCNNGLKGDNGSDTGHRYAKNLTVDRNYFKGLGRMAMEYQGGAENVSICDNYYELPAMWPGAWQQNDSVFAFSIIFNGQKTRNCVAKRNFVKGLPLIRRDNGQLSTTRVDGEGVRIAFEMGNNWTCEDNYAEGGHLFSSVWMQETTVRPPTPIDHNLIGPTVVRNNRVINWRFGPTVHGWDDTKGRYSQSNNTPTTPLTWDINRPRPGPGRNIGTGGPPPPPPPTDPPPTTNPTALIVQAKAGPEAGVIELTLKTGAPASTVSIVSTGDGVNRGSVALPAGGGVFVIETISGWTLKLTVGTESVTLKTAGNPPAYNPSPTGYPAPKLRTTTPPPPVQVPIQFEGGTRNVPGLTPDVPIDLGRWEYDPATGNVRQVRAPAKK